MINAVTKEVALEILDICRNAGDWKIYRETIVHLSKRRQQHSSVVLASVEVSLDLIEKMPDRETKLQFVETLRDVTEGKIFLEVQRARLTRTLAEMYENEGKIEEASSIMQDVQVETYGTMENAEKVDFILEQIRLCLIRGDWIRVSIIQKKIDRQAIDDESMQQLKLRFYRMIYKLHAHKDETLELARSHLAVFKTKCIQERKEDWTKVLAAAAIFIVLSPFGKDQADLLARTQTMEAEKLKMIPHFATLLKFFTTKEIIAWPFSSTVQKALSEHAVFKDEALWGTRTKEWTARLRRRVLEHNVRIVSTYYSRIRLTRLAEMIGIDADKAEQLVADMVSSLDDDDNSEPLYAKIDRPTGIISFQRPKSANAQMTEWATNISDVLELVEETRHLINRENQVAKASKS